MFKGNAAHSIEGIGARIFPNPGDEANSAECYEGSHFAAWHNRQNGVLTHDTSVLIKMTEMVLIDNGKGISIVNGN